jgi:Ca2+-binding RTX toxin-like protein
MVSTGAYVGNSAAAVGSMEQWLGKPLDYVAVHTGRASWDDWEGSIGWQIGNFKDVDATLRWSIPMFANGGTLAAGAAGDYDAHYVSAAKKLAAAFAGEEHIIVRVGEEFNGSWMPWAAKGKEADFIENYRNFVDAFRSVSDKFLFEWNVNIGDFGMDPAKAYPGDGYVDIIGMDFYYDTKWDNPDPVQAWNYMVGRKYGLQWLENFADQHGKPSAYSEWGVNSPTAGPFIALAAEWFEAHDNLYNIYWNSNADFAGKLSDGLLGTASTVFQDIFGGNGEDVIVTDVASATSAILGDGQLNLTLTGTAAIDGTGNALGNKIIGNDAANRLTGGAGDDTLDGRGGNDILDGGAGADRMIGGAGNDSYHVDDIGDVVVEYANGGTDTVYSKISYTLGGNVENLVLQGSGPLSGTGNALANSITGGSGDDRLFGLDGNDMLTGGAGNDLLDGGKGNDVMTGGAGDDVYVVDTTGDKVIEAAGGGIDTVRAGMTYTLPKNVENLVLLWSGNSAGTGNELANRISGNGGANVLKGFGGNDIIDGGGGNDVIWGGTGNDVLTGGSGSDRFVFERGGGKDVVTDFGAGGTNDIIDISAFLKAGIRPTITDTGADTLISFNTGDSIRLLGIHPQELQPHTLGYV